MTIPQERRFAISFQESLRFAAASGDFNPLHVDPLAARRTQFGGTVVHGIHAMLRALEAIAGDRLIDAEPATLAATFNNPVRTGETVCTRWSEDSGKIRIIAEAEGRHAFSIGLKLTANTGSARAGSPPAERPGLAVPKALEFPPSGARGEVPLVVDPSLLRDLFPLIGGYPVWWIADLLASTRLVGMECPGLHSIYSGFKLQRMTSAVARNPTLRYEVGELDDRFRKVSLRVNGAHFEGTLDTFFRPEPVRQPRLEEVVPAVQPGEFRSQRALVVGGSRGLGETVAKILIAGGADVTITYARGENEASAIVREAGSFGGTCRALRLDVTDEQAVLGDGGYTDGYYFASPHIERNMTGRWNKAAYERFSNVYVHAFARLVEATAETAQGREPMRWLYPSTAYLDTREPGFAEYCVAKAAGEEMAAHLARKHRATIRTPRLPRMQTDQTGALLGLRMEPAVPVLARAIRSLRE